MLETLLEFSRSLPAVASAQAGLPAVGRRAGLTLSITTKSDLVLRDIPLLQELSRGSRLSVNLSVTTLNPRLARVLEPRAPRPDLRLEAVRRLNQAGVAAGVFVLPILPGITDRPEELDALVAAAADAGARYLCSSVVFLMPSAQKKFFPFLEQKFPRLVKRYRKWFQRSAYAPESYRREISRLMGRLRARHGVPARWPDEEDDEARAPAAGSPDYSALLQATRLATGGARPQLPLPFAC